MSIKAYDGMKCNKDLHFIQTEISKRIDKFKEFSINELTKTYADIIIKHADEKYYVRDNVEFIAINEQKTLDEIKNIKPTTLISYLYQSSKILSKSSYINDFMVNLKLTLDCKENKILIYPNIIVNEHKNILLEFLDDWYYQNQSDPDENVCESEWLERGKDWLNFNENGFKTEITLFDPTDIMYSLNVNFRGQYLIDKILEKISTNDERLNEIAINKLVKSKIIDKSSISEYMNVYNEVISDKQLIDDYIKKNNIILTIIDEEYLTKTIV